jgi:hypothetical protein
MKNYNETIGNRTRDQLRYRVPPACFGQEIILVTEPRLLGRAVLFTALINFTIILPTS